MKRFARTAILTLLVASSPAFLVGADGGTPKAVVEKTTIDVGSIPRGETIQADFIIKNEGTATLEITSARPSCGCTVADFDRLIEPGKSGKIHAVVDTVSLLGANGKTVTVTTNDPANPRFQLTIQSDVKPFVFADPGYARYTLFVHNDRDQTINQIVYSRDFPGLEILSIDSPKPFIKVNKREARPDERAADSNGNQWVIEITLSKETPIGPVSENVRVTFNHPKQKVMDIPVSGFIRPVVAVTPPSLNLGKVNPADPQKWGVLVKNFGSQALELGAVQNDIPGIDVAVESIEIGRQFKIVFTPKAGMPKGDFAGKVTVKTNLAQQGEIVVELKGTVQ